MPIFDINHYILENYTTMQLTKSTFWEEYSGFIKACFTALYLVLMIMVAVSSKAQTTTTAIEATEIVAIQNN